MTLDQRDPATCFYPPHPDEPGPGGEQERLATDSAARRFARWARHAPAERIPPVAVPVVWTAAEIMHAVGVSGVLPGMATLAAAGVAYGAAERRTRVSEHKRLAGAEVAAVTGVTGTWLTAATSWGPLAGPDHLLSIVYGLGAAGGYWWLRHHEAVLAARARRDAAAAWEARKVWWHALAPRLGMQGSHLLKADETFLGDTLLIDTRGTGQRASHLASADLAERIAEIEMLSPGRVDVTRDKIAGRLRISIRRDDPWAKPIPHPLTVSDSPYAKYVPYPATIREPLTIGVDPETGKPLRVPLWVKGEGGRVVLIAGKKSAGKTVLLNNLTERITACPDARLLTINLSKVLEDDIWSPLTEASALNETGLARRILAFSQDGIKARSRPPAGVPRRRTAIHQPAPDEPLFVVKVDEVDAVSSDEACKAALSFIASKCRGEGWALIVAGQRATAAWMGGADLRANVDLAIWGRFARAGEARHVAGAEVELPDMGAYGEGASGVFGVTELGAGGDYEKGRTFLLSEPEDLERIVAERLRTRPPYDLEPALAGLAEAWAKITRRALPDTAGDDHDDDGRRGFASGDDDENESASDRLDATRTRRRLADAMAAGTAPVAAPLDDESEQKIAEWTQRRKELELAKYRDFELPEIDQRTLRAMLARPDGVSTRDAAAATPGGYSHKSVHQQFMRWRAEGTVEKRGRGALQRFHATSPGAVAPAAAPYLHVVPDSPAEEEDAGQGA